MWQESFASLGALWVPARKHQERITFSSLPGFAAADSCRMNLSCTVVLFSDPMPQYYKNSIWAKLFLAIHTHNHSHPSV